ncbi:hypothetical protein SPRG_01505 [Saprolegnia parasitica CBS 223.65]|uniref:Uncharacterized protein n=1 Tax=Saprolegnia parasitica (strain CBS 223.65) TaxID=695850 RepID=A0A067CUI7_SAPPC|nr:hypothetical protein SPRG_01505 [Saprolegnia parasitica CBS 223.65]KDO34369.1 hypothetical protein SPRG_01505 [Saprolegnia parasitica CBS 223.65]|eukprot:XP_012195105.1 hypothetical protein SPRG_01505 [Saprolegnia parasitica CBS 223.65]
MAARSYVAELSALFAADPDIDEIGLIYLEDPAEAFVLKDHKLGIALDMLPALHREAKDVFFAARRSNDVDRIREATRCMLLVCADFYTAWNARKQLLVQGLLSLRDEITFINVVLSHHSKSIDTWAHRRWVLDRLVATTPLTASFLSDELALCLRLTEQYPRNYHAWSYRYRVCCHLSPAALVQELDTNRAWCERHVADHSGWNHRQLLLARLLPSETLLEDEFAFHTPLLRLFPGREALWCHRRALLHAFLTTAPRPCAAAMEAWCARATVSAGHVHLSDAPADDATFGFVARELLLAVQLPDANGLETRYLIYALEAIMMGESMSPHVRELHATLCQTLAAADPTHSNLWQAKATT